MNPILLHQLSPGDIQWLTDVGEKQRIEPASLLMESKQNSEFAYLVLAGGFGLSLIQQGGESKLTELQQLVGGDLFGAIPFIPLFLPEAEIRALAPSVVLRVSRSQLEQKLLKDLPFAARFYRAVAHCLKRRLDDYCDRCGYSLALLKHLQLKEASTLFAALQDADLDWLIAVGQVQDFATGDWLTAVRQPLDAFHIILEGAFGLQAPEQALSSVQLAFSAANELPRLIEFSRLSRGELLGDSLFVDPMPPAYGARALRPSRLLSIPRWRLETKLSYDPHFAAQLYRLLAIVLANKQDSLLRQLGFDLPMQELNDQLLHQVNVAEARFEWLLKRLREPARGGAVAIAA